MVVCILAVLFVYLQSSIKPMWANTWHTSSLHFLSRQFQAATHTYTINNVQSCPTPGDNICCSLRIQHNDLIAAMFEIPSDHCATPRKHSASLKMCSSPPFHNTFPKGLPRPSLLLNPKHIWKHIIRFDYQFMLNHHCNGFRQGYVGSVRSYGQLPDHLERDRF